MIAFRIDSTELDLNPDTSVQVEYYSSLFETDRIPGMLTYPVTLPWSKKNKRLLGFPGQLSVRHYRREPFACEMYLDNLWRVGKLYILGTSEKGISVNFQSDIGDLGESLKNDSLRELPLGAEPLATNVRGLYPESNYALLPVRNDLFYGKKAADIAPNYSGYVNFYDNGFKAPSLQHPCTPFPYLVHILRQVMGHYGYKLTGAWLEEESTRRLVIYNTCAIDQAGSQVEYTRHVPDIKVNEFLKAVRATFGLGFLFNTTTKTVEVVRLKDVIADTGYTDWQQRGLRVSEWKPNTTEGFRLGLSPDSSDELNKELPPSATAYQVGRGKEPINLSLGTLTMEGGAPVASQEGYSLALGQGQDKFSLSLLYYHPEPTPKGQALVLSNLYEQHHREWLEFLAETETIEAEIDLNITDIRTLRQERKVMVRDEHSIVKALWSRISITVSLQHGIQAAKAPLLKVRN